MRYQIDVAQNRSMLENILKIKIYNSESLKERSQFL